MGQPSVGVLSPVVSSQLLARPLSFQSHEIARVADADTIKLESGDRKITFARPEGTWKVTQPISADADHDALEAFLTSLSPLRRRVDQPKADGGATQEIRPGQAGRTLALAQRRRDQTRPGHRRRGRQGPTIRPPGCKDLVFVLDAKLSGQVLTVSTAPGVEGEYRSSAGRGGQVRLRQRGI